MGKQLSFYLEPPYDAQLAQAAAREGRRPHVYAKWILLKALAEMQESAPQPKPQSHSQPQQDVAA